MVIGKSEQRGFSRMNLETKLTFKVRGKDVVYEGTCKDLSATGVRFITGQKLNAGDMIEISIKPGVDITPPLLVNISIIRVTATDNGLYEIAGTIQKSDNA